MNHSKADLTRELIELSNNIDVEQILNSEDKMFYIVNKYYIPKFKEEKFMKRVSKQKINEFISIVERYQLGGK